MVNNRAKVARARSSASTMTLGGSLSRPMSSASMTSMDSNATQPTQAAVDHAQQLAINPLAQVASWTASNIQPFPSQPLAMNTNNPFVQPQQQNSYQTNPILLSHSQSMPLERPATAASASFNYPDQLSVAGADGLEDNQKRGSATAQANDIELKRLFRENKDKSLDEVAGDVRREEKGPRAEKSKQIYGMLWLSQNIQRSSQSVPRNRVFNAYGTRCSLDHLPMLNPASFGKLVRIIIPNITTRRLGVRGESKYHYVNLCLINDDGRQSVPPQIPQRAGSDGHISRPSSTRPLQSATADKAFFLPLPQTNTFRSDATPTTSNTGTSKLYLAHPSVAKQSTLPGRDQIINRDLYFLDSAHSAALTTDLELPDINPYLPSGTDRDAADCLVTVYRSHCSLAIDNFRYCKPDQFCETYKSMIGLLTVPGQKLLANLQVAPWIEACDRLKYQRMVPMLRQIMLAEVPLAAMRHMEKVAESLCSWIAQYFGQQPSHTIVAMLRPATMFCNVVKRFIRVNRTAHDVATTLNNDEARNVLWNDWIQGVQPLEVAENSLRDHGHTRLLTILTAEAKLILKPNNLQGEELHSHLFDIQDSSPSEFSKTELDLELSHSAGTNIDRLVRFLENLPSRFPGVDARTFLDRMDVVQNQITRNLTLNRPAAGLQTWWIISMFMSEMMYYLAESGGFLHNPEPEVEMQDAGIASKNGVENNNYNSPYGMPANVLKSNAAQSSGAPKHTDSSDHLHATQVNAPFVPSLEEIRHSGESHLRQSLGGQTMVADDDDFAIIGKGTDLVNDTIDFSLSPSKDEILRLMQGMNGMETPAIPVFQT